MTTVDSSTHRRQRGSIRPWGTGYQIRVSAGLDPVTGKRVTLVEHAVTEKAAERIRTKLLAEADDCRTSRTAANVGNLLDRWLPQHEVDPSTRATYESLIRNHIRPALGQVALTTLVRRATETLESFYADLRRCRGRCDGTPRIEHVVDGGHDCAAMGCGPHECRPLAASSVRQIHAVLSGALTAAVRWGWVPFNPTEAARQPSKPRPRPMPPTAEQAARIVEVATAQSPEWGLYIWLAIVLGARRGELCGLRWGHVDLDAGMVEIDTNYVHGTLKDTKTHQMRKISIDSATVELLRQHRADRDALLAPLGVALTSSSFVFSAAPDCSRPRDPSSMTRRYKRMTEKLGIDSHLHALRHYSATTLLTAGVDLRTVAGRLGHGDGTTTLRYYAAWIESADQRAAAILSSALAPPATVLATILPGGDDDRAR